MKIVLSCSPNRFVSEVVLPSWRTLPGLSASALGLNDCHTRAGVISGFHRSLPRSEIPLCGAENLWLDRSAVHAKHDVTLRVFSPWLTETFTSSRGM